MVTLPPFDIQPELIGARVTLRPLLVIDYDALYTVASDPEIWAMHPFPDRYKKDVFDGFFADAITSCGAFAVINNATNDIIGSTRFAHFNADANEIEFSLSAQSGTPPCSVPPPESPPSWRLQCC